MHERIISSVMRVEWVVSTRTQPNAPKAFHLPVFGVTPVFMLCRVVH